MADHRVLPSSDRVTHNRRNDRVHGGMGMRRYILGWLLLSGMVAAQRLKFPILHRDHMDAERAALSERLTRLAETRKSLGLPAAQPSSSAELDALTAAAQPKRSVSRVARQRVKRPAAITRNTWPPPCQTWSAGDPDPSLGEVARKYRAQKQRAPGATSSNARE